ncbi:MAG: ATP-binding protein, partial [Clostridia bacterium]|nr:ATP-binding protein [Clostridia bacterium]
VLALYLSLHQITERMSAMLKCTLPFTIYNPFVHDGGRTADEMFFGRTRELRSILDPNGACVVYGGRQLGKTALLARAESLFSKPQEGRYAAHITTFRCRDEEQFVSKITAALKERTSGKINLTRCTTIADFAAQLEALFHKGVFRELLLLIDEADDFLDAIASQNYAHLWPLVDLRNHTKRCFKIVLAGLHNVYRAQSAVAHNSVFGQLGTSLCVEPLSPADALQLLTRPLNYLGFRINQLQHIETILTNTNYYPGILQFFGYKLVEAMTTQYSRYYRAVGGNPPFALTDEQLGAVMSSADLNHSIHHKFRLSLELDPRYYMIARCVTMLHHLYEEDRSALNWMGYSVQEIQQISQEYDIHCLASADRRMYILLMDEMVRMGILSSPCEGRYRLRRSSFIDVIGRDLETLDAEINAENGGDDA